MDKRASAWSFWLAFWHRSSICFLKLNFSSKVMHSSFSYSLSLIDELLIATVALEHLLPSIMR